LASLTAAAKETLWCIAASIITLLKEAVPASGGGAYALARLRTADGREPTEQEAETAVLRVIDRAFERRFHQR
jgi:hypothetical protein